MERITKFAQGSVWLWEKQNSGPNNYQKGVQSGVRPVIVVSNDMFNTFSPVVTCLTITTAVKDSPVHIPLFVTENSEIQCEQIHTVPKFELVKYQGCVSGALLNTIKDKLKIQFNIVDRNNERREAAENRSVVDNRPVAAPQPAIPTAQEREQNRREAFVLDALKELLKRTEISTQAQPAEEPKQQPPTPSETKPPEASEKTKQPKLVEEPPQQSPPDNADKPNRKAHGRNRYTPEDLAFILDKLNDAKLVAEKYNIEVVTVYGMRTRYGKKAGV